MIIPNMYHTKIQVYSDSGYTTPSYNINIDGTAYIKVKLFDFNGDPVVGESVTLYYDDATSIYTGTTDGNGEISTSHTCSEWGIHTFSTNNINTQIHVSGAKLISNLGNNIKLWVDGSIRLATIYGSNISLSAKSGEFAIATIPSAYKPKGNEVITASTFSGISAIVRTDGDTKINAYNWNKALTGLSFTLTYYY